MGKCMLEWDMVGGWGPRVWSAPKRELREIPWGICLP